MVGFSKVFQTRARELVMARLLSLKKMPDAASPGDVVYNTTTRDFYIAVADGSLLNLADLLSGSVPHVRAVGPQGPAGQRGEKGDKGERGERGEKGTPGNDGQQGLVGPKGADGMPGLAGKDGKDGKYGENGKDSIVPGPRGERGERGEKGDKGERGDVTVVGDPELQAAVEKIRAQKAAAMATIAEKLAAMGDHPVYTIAKAHLEDVKKTLGG